MEVVAVPIAVVTAVACLGRGGGVGACRNCRGHNRGLSGPDCPPTVEVATPLGPARDDDEMEAVGPEHWPAAVAADPVLVVASCTRVPSRGLHGAELEPKSLASRVMGSRICERRRADDEPRISSIVLGSRASLIRRCQVAFYYDASSCCCCCPPASASSCRESLSASGSSRSFPSGVIGFFLRGIDSIPTLGEQRLLILAILLPHTLVRSSSIATRALRCDLYKKKRSFSFFFFEEILHIYGRR